VALILIAALFIVPLALAWMMYSGVIDYRPGSTRNHGRLVEPPQPVVWSDARIDGQALTEGQNPFAGHWVLLHAVPDPCDESCRAAVTDLRQVHRAAGRDQARIQVALLLARSDAAAENRLREIYPAFRLVNDTGRRLWPTLDAIAAQSAAPGAAEGGTFLVDPLGNIMMAYEAGSDPNGLKKDLKRLLTWSKLDKQQ
jgi:hypothetical protein